MFVAIVIDGLALDGGSRPPSQFEQENRQRALSERSHQQDVTRNVATNRQQTVGVLDKESSWSDPFSAEHGHERCPPRRRLLLCDSIAPPIEDLPVLEREMVGYWKAMACCMQSVRTL